MVPQKRIETMHAAIKINTWKILNTSHTQLTRFVARGPRVLLAMLTLS